jgi:hypothetical protein
MARIRGAAISILAAALILSVQPARITAQQPPEELQQLVAPVALYPDALLAEVLAAATFPADVDEAAQWMQRSPFVNADQVATAVDAMPWDASVKALTEFPTVLANMEQNLSWVSALGDAYFNQPDDVMEAVQMLRRRAIAAGTLQSNAQITVTNQNGVIVITPADAGLVYVPTYDCWMDFGTPIDPWPYYLFPPGFARGSRIVWGAGFHIGGIWGRVSWGWSNWAFDWAHRRVEFHRGDYVSHSPSVIDRRYPPRTGAPTGRAVPRPGTPSLPGRERSVEIPSQVSPASKPGAVSRTSPETPAQARDNRGFPPAKPVAPPTGTHSGAMSGIGHGGAASSSSSRGQSSMGAHPAPSRSAPPPAAGRGRGRL